jgi:hypothetical protein
MDLLLTAAVLDFKQILCRRPILWLVRQARFHRTEQPLRNESVARQNLTFLRKADLVIWVCDDGRLLIVVFDVLERGAAIQQAVQDAAQRPNVTFEVNLQLVDKFKKMKYN